MQGWEFACHTAVWPCVAQAPPPWYLVLVAPTQTWLFPLGGGGAPCFHVHIHMYSICQTPYGDVWTVMCVVLLGALSAQEAANADHKRERKPYQEPRAALCTLHKQVWQKEYKRSVLFTGGGGQHETQTFDSPHPAPPPAPHPTTQKMVSNFRGIEAAKSKNPLGDCFVGQKNDFTRGWTSNIMPCYQMTPPKRGCMASAPALDLTTSLSGCFTL